MFQKEGCTLKEFKVSTQSKLKYMYSLQVAVNSNTLRMVHNKLAVKHLKDLREKRTSGNRLKVEHANNCHDDYADAIGLCVYQFDKTSPVYVGLSKLEDEDDIPKNVDLKGKFLGLPTAQQISDHIGNEAFYDNRKEHDAKKDDDEGDSGDFWFAI